MAITTMCNKDATGAFLDDYWTNRDGTNPNHREIWMQTTHVGLVISLGEVNGSSDSDFYAIVWNPEKRCEERVEYASTRGWTYPNRASVDLTPEHAADRAEWLEERRQAAIKRQAEIEAATPKKGRRVKVVGGRKLAKGTEGEVFWVGPAREFGAFPRNGYKAHGRELRALAMSYGIGDPRDGLRVGIVVGEAKHVEVVR